MRPFAAILALVVFSTSAFARGEYQDEDELRLVRDISVYIQDEVNDGCLSNPNALKVEAELILRRSGITVADYDPQKLGYRLFLKPFGGAEKLTSGQPSGICVATLQVLLWRFAPVPEGHAALITAYNQRFLITGQTKAEMQEGLRTVTSEIVSDLANEILKARGK